MEGGEIPREQQKCLSKPEEGRKFKKDKKKKSRLEMIKRKTIQFI